MDVSSGETRASSALYEMVCKGGGRTDVERGRAVTGLE
jgi:hypothetical protein